MKIKRDQVAGAVLVLLGIIVFVMTNQLSVPFTLSYPGPKALPMIAAVGFMICGAGVFLEGCKEKLAVYVFAASLIGYLIVTPFVTYALTTLFAKGSKSTLKGRVIYSVLLTAIIYVVYIYVFGLSLPSGALF